MFLAGGLTHYYNLVLSRLNEQPGMQIVVVTTAGDTAKLGPGVHQTKEGINFRVYPLPESRFPFLWVSHRGLSCVLWKEKPDAVVAPDNGFLAFMLHPALRFTVAWFHIRLIMQSIPFRLLKYDEARARLLEPTSLARLLPEPLSRGIQRLRMDYVPRLAYLLLRRWAFRRADAHLNYIDEAYEIFGSYGVSRERIFVAYNSPDTDTYRQVEIQVRSQPPILPSKPHRVIHVGRLVEWKRVDLLIDALALVRGEFPDAEVVVVGFGPEEGHLKEQAKRLGLTEAVRFVGGAYDPVLLGRYFAASSVYVLAGMGGLSINDAMYFRMPVICSVCDGTEKALVRDGYNGFFFAEGNAQDLAQKIARILRDPPLRERMAANSRRIIDEEINIHTVLDRYKEAFAFACR